MKLTWLGHACFLLETDCGSVVFDPYEPGYVPGLALPPRLCADLVLCSHGHKDHGCRSAVSLTGAETGFRITAIESYHDDQKGKQRGMNMIFALEAEGKRIVHLGDLGHIPSEGTVRALRGADVLMIPVGGYYTIDAAGAAEVCRLLEPKITIPMHYRGEGFGYDVLGTEAEFTAYFADVHYLDTNAFDPADFPAGRVVVPKCPTVRAE